MAGGVVEGLGHVEATGTGTGAVEGTRSVIWGGDVQRQGTVGGDGATAWLSGG